MEIGRLSNCSESDGGLFLTATKAKEPVKMNGSDITYLRSLYSLPVPTALSHELCQMAVRIPWSDVDGTSLIRPVGDALKAVSMARVKGEPHSGSFLMPRAH